MTGRPRTTAAQPRFRKRNLLMPLDYMLEVMRDPTADETRRDRMAVAAAPYLHGRSADALSGKKGERKDAAEKAAGLFNVPQAPKLVVNNRPT